MKEYICTIDEEYCKELLSKGYYLLDSFLMKEKEVFVFMPPKGTKDYSKIDKDRCFFINKRFF
jgi:hypothetical protein